MKNRPSIYNPLNCSIIIFYVIMVAIVDVIISPIEVSEANTPTYNQNKEQNKMDDNAAKIKHEQASIVLPLLAS